MGVAADVGDGESAHAEDEGGEVVGGVDAAGAEGFEGGEEDLLCEVGGVVLVAQVAQAVEANAGGHAADELGFGVGACGGGGDALGESGVGKREDFQSGFIVTLCGVGTLPG
jgi:hypothetical protein